MCHSLPSQAERIWIKCRHQSTFKTVLGLPCHERHDAGGTLAVLCGYLLTITLQEVIVASSLKKHPNIVSFLGASFEGSSIQIVYELVDGCTLEQLYNEECSGKR